MAKFVFGFEQLLNIKRKIEKQEQMNLGKAMKALSASMQKLEITKYHYNDSVKGFQNSLSSNRIDPTKIKRLNVNVAFYHTQVKEQEALVTRNEDIVEKAREKLKLALKERKTFEILKEKAYEVYMEEEKAVEAKVIDEIVSFKYKDER